MRAHRLRAPAAFLAAALLAPAAAADWASFHNDSLGAGHVANSAYPVFEDVWWSNKTLANQQIYASPVIKDQVVVVADRGGLVRGLDAESGSQLWAYRMAGAVEGTPAIAGERVYVVDVQGNLKALNLRDGRVETTASTPVGPTQASIREHQGKIFVGNNAGQMRAYYASTLQLLWTFDLNSVYSVYAPAPGSTPPAPSVCQSLVSAQPIYGAPAVHGGRVFFGSFNHWFFAVDENGLGNGRTTLLWMYKAGDIFASSPAVRIVDSSNYRVLATNYDGKLYNFNGGATAAGGSCTPGSDQQYSIPVTPVWTYTVPLGVERKFDSSPAVAGDRVFFGANNGHTYAVNANDGILAWETDKTGSQIAPVTSSPAVANGIVVVGSKDKNVYWLDANTNDPQGKVLKSFSGQGAFGTSPAIDGDRAYIAATDGAVYMFGPKVPPRPDLVVASIAAGPTQVTVAVRNAGDKEAGASKVRLLMDGALLADLEVPKLDPGAWHNVTYAGTIGAASHTFAAQADFGAPDAVKESNESNNLLQSVQVIGAPPPPPATAATSTTTTGGKGKIPAWDLAAPLAVAAVALLLRRRIR